MTKPTVSGFFWLGCALAIVVALNAINQRMESDLECTYVTFRGAYRTPVVIIQRKPKLRPGCSSRLLKQPTVLLIHGLSASKSIMLTMGLSLANAGARCYLIDLPGHGASTERFSVATSKRVVQEISDWIRSATSPVNGCPEEDFFLIGHSLGGGLAIEIARQNECISGVVAVSPASVPVEYNSPPHLLLLYGENDFPFVRRGAVFLFERVTGIPSFALDRKVLIEDSERTHSLVTLPWMEHSGSLFLPSANQEIKNWINWTAEYSSLDPANDRSRAPQVIVKGLLCAAAIASWFPAFALVSRGLLGSPVQAANLTGMFRDRITRVQKSTTAFETYTAYTLSSVVSIVLLKWFSPWNRLHLMGGGFLTGFLCLMGIALIVWRNPFANAMNFTWRGFFCAVAGFLLLVSFPLTLITKHFVHLELTIGRLWRLPIIAFCIFPFFLWDEWVFRLFLNRDGRWKLGIHFLSTRLIMSICLMLGFYLLKSTEFLVLLLLPGLLLLSLFGWMCSGWVFTKTRSYLAAAVFNSLCTGWIFGIFFPQL